MKPISWTLNVTMKKMNCNIEDDIFEGDTARDYYCSKEMGCRFIGMAPTEKKRNRLSQFLTEESIVANYYDLCELVIETKSIPGY